MKSRKLAAMIVAATTFAATLVTPATAAETAPGSSPLINRNTPVYSDTQDSAAAANNEIYYDGWRGTVPGYLAFDLSGTPAENRTTVNLAWYATWTNYDYTVLNESPYAAPAAYTIAVNAAEGGAYPEEGWVNVLSVTENPCHSRQNVFDMTGYNWVRLTVDEMANGAASCSLNVDIHDCSSGTVDGWLMLGDSITAGGVTTFSTGDGNIADLVHAICPDYYPAQENGGIGGILSRDGKANIDRWLSYFPGQYVSIAYGTNDCWGNQAGAQTYYENTVYMIEAIQAAGKTAVLPTIPFSLEPGVSAYVGEYNAMVARIYTEYPDVVKGPDFYSYFEEHPEGLSADGVHPNGDGYNEMRKIWAQTMCETIYQTLQGGGSLTREPIRGDINGDETVTIADAVLLVKYLLSETDTLCDAWKKTADLDGDETITAADLTILKQIHLHAAS